MQPSCKVSTTVSTQTKKGTQKWSHKVTQAKSSRSGFELLLLTVLSPLPIHLTVFIQFALYRLVFYCCFIDMLRVLFFKNILLMSYPLDNKLAKYRNWNFLNLICYVYILRRVIFVHILYNLFSHISTSIAVFFKEKYPK